MECYSDPEKYGSPSKNTRYDDRKLPSNAKEVEDLRRDSAANPLIAFTFEELKVITDNFRPDHLLGGGGFGRVYKGFITEDLREGIQPLQVAVKVHDGDNSDQGHREWLVTTPTSSFLMELMLDIALTCMVLRALFFFAKGLFFWTEKYSLMFSLIRKVERLERDGRSC